MSVTKHPFNYTVWVQIDLLLVKLSWWWFALKQVGRDGAHALTHTARLIHAQSLHTHTYSALKPVVSASTDTTHSHPHSHT